MTTRVVTRRAGLADLDTVLDDLAAGFASYGEFAPAGWRPPDREAQRDREAEILADPATWTLLALVDTAAVGHVAFSPARERRIDEPGGDWRARQVVPGLAHLRQLFVLPDWWGRGVAPVLHDEAIAEMRARGYGAARLYTPARHARARRFYERRGWSFVGQGRNEDLGLTLAEYRLALEAYAPGSQPGR
jgi:GNAT superfamily N-acetyltransferase